MPPPRARLRRYRVRQRSADKLLLSESVISTFMRTSPAGFRSTVPTPRSRNGNLPPKSQTFFTKPVNLRVARPSAVEEM
jgi:hypothetical protein